MTLNASGPISIAGTTAGQSIQIELGGTGTTQMSLNCSTVRTLAGVPSGAIVMPTNFWGKSNAPPPFGCATYTVAGTYSFVVPTGQSKICVVCVGAGGGGVWANCICCGQGAGGGGALSYTNCIPVTAGETLTVIVGAGAAAGNVGCSGSAVTRPSGGPSSVSRGATVLVSAAGGGGGTASASLQPYIGGAGGAAGSGVGAVKYSGGNGTQAGGGAAGYAGAGASTPGPKNTTVPGVAGTGGSAGSGSYNSADRGSAGGGVGLVVQGPSGAGGSAVVPITGGGGGSSGTAGNTSTGGAYGGGGGSVGDSTSTGGAGGVGGVRIIYGGTSKTHPNNSAP